MKKIKNHFLDPSGPSVKRTAKGLSPRVLEVCEEKEIPEFLSPVQSDSLDLYQELPEEIGKWPPIIFETQPFLCKIYFGIVLDIFQEKVGKFNKGDVHLKVNQCPTGGEFYYVGKADSFPEDGGRYGDKAILWAWVYADDPEAKWHRYVEIRPHRMTEKQVEKIIKLAKEALTFYEKYHQGKETEESIDDYIDEWHEGDSELPLHEYLGMTLEQYSFWVKTTKIPEN